MSQVSQKRMILEHLHTRGPITQLEALREYGVMRLAVVVHRLRRDGHPVRTNTVRIRNRHGEPVEVAQYELEVTP